MMLPRAGADRGSTRRAGVLRRHGFARGDYHDARWTGFGALRVLDELELATQAEEPAAVYANMLVLWWPLSGTLHWRSEDAAPLAVQPGTLLAASAGHGLRWSLHNPASTPLRALEFWLQPLHSNLTPQHRLRAASVATTGWTLLAAAADQAHGDALPLPAAARLRVWRAAGDEHGLLEGVAARVWLQVTRGALMVGPQVLTAGDGLGVEPATTLPLRALEPCEALALELS